MKPYFHTHRNPIAVIISIIIMAGVLVYVNMEKSLLPEITFPKIKVIADDGLQPVNKMMVTVTKPLENAIKEVPNLQFVRSTTSRGSCEISAFMDWGTNIDLAKQRIEAEISQIKNDLPPNVQVTVKKMTPSILPVMRYALESRTETPIELKHLAQFTIKPFLSQVEGVADAMVIGGKTQEFWVELNQSKMTELSITPAMISQALSQTNFILSNGFMPDYRRLYLTVTNAMLTTPNELGNIVISNNGKRIILLKDIATVVIHPAIEYIRINANGKSAVLIAIVKQPNANLLDVSSQVEAKIAALKKTLPKDVTLTPSYIQSDFVHEAIHSVSDALWLGILLAIIVAIIFLRSGKASATILITVPTTLILTLIVMFSVGYTINIITVGALAAAIALIVDDSIVVIEQIHRTHEEHHDEPASTLVSEAIHYLFPAMIASSLSTIVIFIPFSFMTGVAGSYFKVLANTMIITLVCSFFVSWIGLPVIYLLFSRKKPRQKNQKNKKVKTQRWVSFFIRRPVISISFIAAVIIAIILIIPRLETGFLPIMDEGTIVMDYVTPPGTSLDETDRMCRQMEKIIMSEPEVESYSRRTGTQMGFFITEPNTGDYQIQLKKTRSRTTFQVIDDLRKKIEASQPAIRIDFGQVISDMIGDLTTSAQPIEIKIFGNDQQVLNKLARQVATVIDKVPGTADVFDGITIAGPSVSIIPRYATLAQYGITPADLQYQMQTGLEGNVIGQVLEPEQMVDVRMIYSNDVQAGVNGIKNQDIFLPNGKLTPITNLANVEIDKGSAEIQRENLQSMSVVSARLNNRDLGSVMKDIQKAVSREIFLPQGYHITYGGQFQEQQQSFRQLLLILITASLLVFCTILFFSKDFISSLIILLVAVLGMGGSMIGLYITHVQLNVSSYTGIIMMVGIIGENAVFTFLQFSDTLKTGTVDDSIIYAISTRLRPKLMTALGAITALMPLALGIGVGAQLHQPLAIAVIGGFIMALPLLLVVLPSLLRLRYRNIKKNQ